MTPDGLWLHGMGIEPYKIREAAAPPAEHTPPAAEPEPRISAEISDGEVVMDLADFNRMLGSLETERAALLGRDHLLTTLAMDNARTAKMWRAMFFISSGALVAMVVEGLGR